MFYIVTQPNCPFCDKAKALLEDKGHDPKLYDLSEELFFRMIFKEMGIKTVPQVWEDGIYIGGYTELVDYLK